MVGLSHQAIKRSIFRFDKPIAQAFLGAAEGEMVKLELENRPIKQFKLLKIERAVESTTAP